VKGFGNSLKIHNQERLLKYLEKGGRPEGCSLLTVCNHASMLDDPALMSSLVRGKDLRTSRTMRWVLGAKEIMFTNSFFTFVCSRGKVIPTVRGDGIYQPAVTYSIQRMNAGDWVHIFPEGIVTLEPVRLKWGVGRMLAECNHVPIILPFWHCGMEDVLPCVEPYIPRFGKKVTVLIGEPIEMKSVIEECQKDQLCEEKTRIKLTNVIQEKMYALQEETERLHAERIS